MQRGDVTPVWAERVVDPLQKQKRSGNWTIGFLKTIKSQPFVFDAYLGQYAEVSEFLAL